MRKNDDTSPGANAILGRFLADAPHEDEPTPDRSKADASQPPSDGVLDACPYETSECHGQCPYCNPPDQIPDEEVLFVEHEGTGKWYPFYRHYHGDPECPGLFSLATTDPKVAELFGLENFRETGDSRGRVASREPAGREGGVMGIGDDGATKISRRSNNDEQDD